MTKPGTVVIRGEVAAKLRGLALARNATPEAVVARLILNEERRTEGLRAAWQNPERRATLSAALKAGWAKAKSARSEAESRGEATDASAD